MALIPAGTYLGRIESAELKESTKEGTEYYGCVCVIKEAREFTGENGSPMNAMGTRIPWSGWLNTQENIQRTVRTMRDAGCTFPEEDMENFAGIGTKDVLFVVETESREYEGKTIKESRIKFVNAIARDNVGKTMSETKKKLLKDRMKAAMSGTPGVSADGSKVDASGKLLSKKGEEIF